MRMLIVIAIVFALVGCAAKEPLLDQCHAAGSFEIDRTATPVFCVTDDDSTGCIKPAIDSGFRRDLKAQLCSTTL